MNITQDEAMEQDQDVELLDDEAEDDVFSAEVNEDGEQDGYELTDEEIAELADEEEFTEDDELLEEPDEEQEEESDPPAEGASQSEDGESAADPDENGAQDEGGQKGGQEPADKPSGTEGEKSGAATPTDYAELAKSDLEAIRRSFPGIGVTDLRKIDNPGRYGTLREMGLSPEEAFRATNHERIRSHIAASARAKADGKAHIRGDMPARQGSAEGFSLTSTQMREYRDLFPDKSEKEITELVRSVSKRN